MVVQLIFAALLLISSALPLQSRLAPLSAEQIGLAEQALFSLTNSDRMAGGQVELAWDADTADIAQSRAEAQLGPRHLSHYAADGGLIFATDLTDANLYYRLAGENLASAGHADTPAIEQALMASPLHRKNILESGFHRVSIGAASDASGKVTFAEIFRD